MDADLDFSALARQAVMAKDANAIEDLGMKAKG
jgi:hypothetical protein